MKICDLSLHKDPEIFNLNELPYRSYFIPFETAGKAEKRREESSYYTSLCGEWLFRYEKSAFDMPDFIEDGAELKGFKRVSVPEMWQMHGEDYLQYQTSPYPFIFDPPHIPMKNPCAAYVKDFNISKNDDKNYELHFEGKDSCIYVWLNGKFVGYGEVPHQDSAFDVTPYLSQGSNRLCVLVFKWSTGSYLDDQDKIRMSGLFRDIYILERAKNGIVDFSVNADMDGRFKLCVQAGSCVQAELFDKDKKIFSCEVEDSFEYTLDSVKLWSAEDPYLYTLMLSCDGEFICKKVGFRSCETKDGVYTINGKPVKIYGINRHDISPDDGYAISYDFMKEELMQIKRYNFNAIRTAHYPNDPRFYELCDSLGLYVMCEADQECHGALYAWAWDRVSGNKQFEKAFVDRMARMYEAFKNYACIVIWSLGNESGWGVNLEKCVDYFNAKDRTRPLHYEAFGMAMPRNLDPDKTDLPVFSQKMDEYINDNFGMVTLGYPSRSALNALMNNHSIKLPIVFHEYSHAMGNSCGDLRFYDDIVEGNERCMGGFIWEWCDQAIRMTDRDGKEYFAYGGDFGEKHHLYNVCMDGVVSPDRIPHSSLLEAGACFSPVKIERVGGNEYEIFNRNFFLTTEVYNIRYEVVLDRNVVASGAILEHVEPCCKKVFRIETYSDLNANDAIIRFFVELKTDNEWAKSGYALYKKTFELESVKNAKGESYSAPTLKETDGSYNVFADGLEYVIRKDEGVISQIYCDGKPLLASPLEFSVWRMPTDNDNMIVGGDNGTAFGGGAGQKWRKTRNFGELMYPWLEMNELDAKEDEDGVIISANFIFAVPGRRHVSQGRIEYRFDGNGMKIRQVGQINEELDFWLARYGYRLHFEDKIACVNYFGYGPEECYEDKREYATLDWYEYEPDDAKNSYEKPQECNSRVDTRWLEFSVGGESFVVSANKFSFCATSYDINENWRCLHKKDMTADGGSYLHLDYRMSGVGSKSCGGEEPYYQCRINPAEHFDFTFEIKRKGK